MTQNIIEFDELISEALADMYTAIPKGIFEKSKIFKIKEPIKPSFPIQYPFAIEKETEKITYIMDANQDKEYLCLDCRQDMFSRALSSDKVRPHFYHKKENEKKCEESYDHYFVKNKMFSILKREIDKDIQLDLWYLKDGLQTAVNLMDSVTSVELEHIIRNNDNTVNAIADIALLNEEGNVLWAIEIVYSHRVERETLEFYKNNGINCLEVYLSGYNKGGYETLHYIEDL